MLASLLHLRRRRWIAGPVLAMLLLALPVPAQEAPKTRWIMGRAAHLPSEYTNQESGYFSIVEGKNGKLYVGTAKYGVNAYLVEFDPVQMLYRMVVDVHEIIMTMVRGFAAQAKIHTRNNTGESGKIYFGSKQGYPEKGEDRSAYQGGYVMAYDPKTGTTENFGIPKAKHGVISVTPDEARGLIYVSTCDDGRPIESSHFMVYDMKSKTYTDLGESQHSYAFIVLDDKGRAYHPKRGGSVMRYDPATKKLDTLEVTVDGQPCPKEIAKDGAILNWDWSPDRKTLVCCEMSTNMLYTFDLTAAGKTIPGKSHGPLLTDAKRTDCRALCVAPDGKTWMAVSELGRKGGQICHLVSYTPGAKGTRDHGCVGIENPDYVSLKDKDGKPRPWHHTLRTEDGVLTPWQPLGICATADGNVYVLTIAPFTITKFRSEQLK